MHIVQVERRSGLLPTEFEREFLTGQGKPVIVTDAMDQWNSIQTWTFDSFQQRFRDRTILIDCSRPSGMHQRVMTFGDYVDYIHGRTLRMPGFCIDRENQLPIPNPEDLGDMSSIYLAGKWNAFLTDPQLLDDIDRTPYFVDDWLQLLPESLLDVLQTTDFRPYWLLFGPNGSLTPLHQDFLHSHAYLAQVVGRKQCRLFSPDDSELISKFPIECTSAAIEKLPRIPGATAWDCIVEPGEMLFLPADWWHHVISLDCSMTVSYNFFTRSNFGDYFSELFRRRPEILEVFERTPNWRESLCERRRANGS